MVVAGRSTESLAIMERKAPKVPTDLLVWPAVALIGTAVTTYAAVKLFPAAFLHTPVGIFPMLVGLACIAAEVIAVPMAIVAMSRDPELQSLWNCIAVAVGCLVILAYGGFFVAFI